MKLKDPEKALLLLQDCLTNLGILPSSFTFHSLIHSFTSQGKMSRAIEVLELMTHDKVRYPFGNFVSSSVISGFCKISKPQLAVGFFENAVNSRVLRPNIATCTALLGALFQLGRVREVSDLVSWMEREEFVFDVVFYSSWICGYFREGVLVEAIRKHKEMIEKGIAPDTVSYTILIDGFSREGYVEKAIGFLEKMKKDGLKPNLVTYTAIMLGFCKKGKLDEAYTLFKMVENLGIEVDEFMYVTLIDGFCTRGDIDCVFGLLEDMEKRGISPSIVTYNSIINGLCKAGRTSEADEVSKGIAGDAVTFSTLLHGYIEEENVKGILETKRRLEEDGVCIDLVMCNTIIKALLMVGALEDAYAFYKGMSGMDLVADSVTYCTMINGYCRVGRIEEALEIFDEFRKTSISSVSCYKCMIYGLCRKGMVDMAIEVFIELNEKGLELVSGTYTSLIKASFEEQGAEGVLKFVHRIENLGREAFDTISNSAICFLCKRGFSLAACEVYMRMRRKQSVVTSRSYYSILKGLISDDQKGLGWPFLNTFLKEYGIDEPRVSKVLVPYMCMKDADKALFFLTNIQVNTSAVAFPVSVLKSLKKNGRILDAYKLVIGAEENLPVMDLVDYSIMIDVLCKEGHLDKALDLCAFVKKKGIALNIYAYNSVINGLCRQGCLVQAFRLFDSLEKIDLVPSEITYATLIDSLCKEGCLLDAKQLFEKMVVKGFNPNVRVYNSLIDGYCKFGNMEEALNLLIDLKARCIKPDEFTVSALINGYCHKGDMEGALGFFFEFKKKDILPDFLGFMYLVRGLCAKGRMEEARGILREMLQTRSVLELINRVDTEIETESVESFIISLCEQGSIQEAVTVLNEVGSIFFPIGRRCRPQNRAEKEEKIYEGVTFGAVSSKHSSLNHKMDLDVGLSNVKKVEMVVDDYDNSEKGSRVPDFESYYSLIASLCSRGELLEANRKTRQMLLDMDTGC